MKLTNAVTYVMPGHVLQFRCKNTRLYEFVKGFTRKWEFLFFVCGSTTQTMRLA